MQTIRTQGDSIIKASDKLPRIGRAVAPPIERNGDEMSGSTRSRSPTSSDEARASSAPPSVTEQSTVAPVLVCFYF